MTECPGCGGPLADDESACSACGLSVGGPTPVEQPEPVAEGQEAETVPSVSPQADGDAPGKLCPECGTLNPMEAQFCVQCRHPFSGQATIFGMSWVVVPALIGVILIVAVVAAFSFGFITPIPKHTTPNNTTINNSAISGANDTARLVLEGNGSAQNGTGAADVRNATLNATPTRTVDPNSTPWNGADGSGIYHTEGGTHHVDVSREIKSGNRTWYDAPAKDPDPFARPTQTVQSWGDGSGHATGPLSWVGTGNWSPGFVSLPAGDAQIVLMSQGTTAFVLVDGNGNQVGSGVFPPPGGAFTVSIPYAGGYAFVIGTANPADTWSATILLPGAGGQAVVPPVPTPDTQILTFAGTGGGTPASFNLSPGTVSIQLYADTMTMAYLKDPWGVTLSTTVAGPSPGGSTVAITRTGQYRLEFWGTGSWTATLTWKATPTGPTYTVPTVNPAAIVTTLPLWNGTTTPATNVTAAPAVTIPPSIITTATPAMALPFNGLPVGASGTASGSGVRATPSITIP